MNRYLLPALTVTALCVVMGASLLKITSYKKQLATLGAQVSAQEKVIASLGNQLTQLKTQGPTVITETLRELAPAPAPVQSEVEEVFTPEAVEPSRLSKIDDLKKRYEELLVSYFVLRKCGKVNPTDYHVLTSALAQEMASLNAPGRLQYDILTSAQGSYQELYSGSTCEPEKTDALYAQYRIFIDAIATQFTPQ